MERNAKSGNQHLSLLIIIMEGAFWILVVTTIIGVVLWLTDRFYFSKKFPEKETDTADNTIDSECCGTHEVCQKSSLSIVDDKIEYFDDEELDSFIGRTADEYDEEEIEQFREVLYTLRPNEVGEWAKSIQLRKIELPHIIRDEMMLIISENQKQ